MGLDPNVQQNIYLVSYYFCGRVAVAHVCKIGARANAAGRRSKSFFVLQAMS
jgi:hypothetical protein